MEIGKNNINGRDMQQGVECVKYNPMNSNYIASCHKNGKVNIWDMRKQFKPTQTFEAHIQSALSLDWHPNQSDILLSSGQDNTIKVWNLKSQNYGMKPLYEIKTQNSVKKAEWNIDHD